MSSELGLDRRDSFFALETQAMGEESYFSADFWAMTTKRLKGQRDDLNAGGEGIVLKKLFLVELGRCEERLATCSLTYC